MTTLWDFTKNGVSKTPTQGLQDFAKAPQQIPTTTYSYNTILPPAFSYTPSQQWLSQLNNSQNGMQFTGLLSGYNPLSVGQQQTAPIWNGFNTNMPTSQSLSAQYLGKGK
jgi:hypothetical protein